MKSRYHTPMSPVWFLGRPGYRRFMAREGTAVCVAAYLVYLLVLLHRIGQGPEAYAAFIAITTKPLSVVVHTLIFGGILYHAITWFNLTPQIMPMYVAEERVPDVWAAIFMGYLPWMAVTVVILWGVMR